MPLEVPCLLISNEFIHSLQHLNGDLKGVEPLGWGSSLLRLLAVLVHCRKLRPIPVRTRLEGCRNVDLKLN